MTTKLRKAEPTGFVYVLRAGNGLYKIGYAIHLDNRTSFLQAESPIPLERVFSGEGSRSLEAYLHQVFEIKRKHGEWFELDSDDLARLQEIVQAGMIPERKKPKQTPKTTINIPSAEMGPLCDLAETMGFMHGRHGNVSGMLKHMIELVQLYGTDMIAAALSHEVIRDLTGLATFLNELAKQHGPRVVAAALQQERLAEVAEGMQEEGDGSL